MSLIIKSERLYCKYNSSEVLTNISFGVEGGEFIGLIGPNGSGKSTLVKIILGIITPSEGAISLFGKDLSVFSDWHKIGYVPQKIVSFNPYFPASVKEVVSLGTLSKKKFPKSISKADADAVHRTMEFMGILDIEHRLIGELSGGQLQKALIAKALVSEPELLILDEPTSSLDPETRENFYSILSELNQKKGITVVLVTHDIWSIGKYASKLLYIDKKILFYDRFENMKDFIASNMQWRDTCQG